MTEASRPNRRDGLSRRDFVQGRFWRGLGDKPNRGGGDNSSSTGDPTDAEIPPSQASANEPPLGPLVMRYPKTLGDVESVDVESVDVESSDQAATESETCDGKEVPGKARHGNALPGSESPIATSPLSKFLSAAPAPSGAARRRTIPVHRPPGAIAEEKFLRACTSCGDCIKACPHDAIVVAPDQMRDAAGTPVILAEHQACWMCEDLPCIDACNEEALSRHVPVMMGTARITAHLCLAHHGTTCTVCFERCPVTAAIEIQDGKPTVNEQSCTGCGVCRYVCPAPENAILLMPAFVRPEPPNRDASMKRT